MIKNCRSENTLDPALDAFNGISVQNSNENAVFGDPKGFLKRFDRVVDFRDFGF